MADPEELFYDIRVLANKAAKHETTSAQLKSWRQMKVHKLKKPGNIAKTIASGAGAAIPIPGISIATDWVIGKAVEWKRTKSHAQKAQKYSRQDEDDTYHKVKWDIKELDVKHLDQSRLKVIEELKKYNSLAGRFWPDKTCERAYELIYAVERTRYRMDKLRLEAAALRVVADEILLWCDQVDNAANYDALREQVIKALDHDSCGKDCYHSDDGESKLRATAARLRAYPSSPL